MKRKNNTTRSTKKNTNGDTNGVSDIQELNHRVETLLDFKNRKELPPIAKKGRPCFLMEMTEYYPDLYKRLIGMIRNGVCGHVAAEAIGVNENTFYDWAKRGRSDIGQSKDTYYSRFFKDIRTAVAICRAECEEAIKRTDPNVWLTLGPGRIFGDQWRKEPRVAAVSQIPKQVEDKNILDVSYEIQEQEVIEDQSETIKITKEEEFEALQALEDAGQITIGREFKKAAKHQRKNRE